MIDMETEIENSTNTVLAAVASANVDTKNKPFFLFFFKEGKFLEN